MKWASGVVLGLLSVQLCLAAPMSKEVGSPHYIFEQSISPADPAPFLLWEIRPLERSANPLSASRKLAEGRFGQRIVQFGLSGTELNEQRIHPGTLWVLDSQGQLRSYHEGIWSHYPQTVVALEGGAEFSLYAATQSGDILELRGPSVQVITRLPAEFRGQVRPNSLHRAIGDEGIECLDARGALFRWDQQSHEWRISDVPDFVETSVEAVWCVADSVYWVWTDEGIRRLDARSGVLQTAQFSAQLHAPLFVDAQSFQLRAGRNLWKVSPSGTGARLTTEVVASEFYGDDLRSYGVYSGLHREILSVRPSRFDRIRIRRSDLETVPLRHSEPKVARPPSSPRTQRYSDRHVPVLVPDDCKDLLKNQIRKGD